jgi:5-methylcytosine-specific restriction protein B
MNTDIATKYPWVPFYEAVADKLLEYKSRDGRKKLLRIILNILNDNQLHNSEDEPVGKRLFYYPDDHLLPDVSPYTFMFFMACSCSTTQGKYVTPKRKRIIELIAKELKINKGIRLPKNDEDYYAIPSTQMRQPGNSRFDCKYDGPGYWYQNEQKILEANGLIWDQFECAIMYASNPNANNKRRLIESYNNVVQNCNGVGYGLTRGMFQIRPLTYLTIDQNTIRYLQRFNIVVPAANELTGEKYLSLLDEANNKVIGKVSNVNSFLDISHLAYIKKGSESEKRNYWMVGYNRGSTNNQ